MKENHFLDDGAYSAVQIIIETVRRRLAGEGDISIELLKQLKEPKDASEFRLKITVRPQILSLTANKASSSNGKFQGAEAAERSQGCQRVQTHHHGKTVKPDLKPCLKS